MLANILFLLPACESSELIIKQNIFSVTTFPILRYQPVYCWSRFGQNQFHMEVILWIFIDSFFLLLFVAMETSPFLFLNHLILTFPIKQIHISLTVAVGPC